MQNCVSDEFVILKGSESDVCLSRKCINNNTEVSRLLSIPVMVCERLKKIKLKPSELALYSSIMLISGTLTFDQSVLVV